MKIGHNTNTKRDMRIKKALPKGESRIRGFSMNDECCSVALSFSFLSQIVVHILIVCITPRFVRHPFAQ